jgi:hypothetical protein
MVPDRFGKRLSIASYGTGGEHLVTGLLFARPHTLWSHRRWCGFTRQPVAAYPLAG